MSLHELADYREHERVLESNFRRKENFNNIPTSDVLVRGNPTTATSVALLITRILPDIHFNGETSIQLEPMCTFSLLYYLPRILTVSYHFIVLMPGTIVNQAFDCVD